MWFSLRFLELNRLPNVEICKEVISVTRTLAGLSSPPNPEEEDGDSMRAMFPSSRSFRVKVEENGEAL